MTEERRAELQAEADRLSAKLQALHQTLPPDEQLVLFHLLKPRMMRGGPHQPYRSTVIDRAGEPCRTIGDNHRPRGRLDGVGVEFLLTALVVATRGPSLPRE